MKFALVDVQLVKKDLYPEVDSFYRRLGYGCKLTSDDNVFGARIYEKLVGAVRLAEESGFLVLRGMYVEKSFQRRGVGGKMLVAIGEFLGPRECWCVPYNHLRDFYSRIGFEDCPPTDAPTFLAKRLNEYIEAGRQVTLMKRPAKRLDR